jgi:hypothetical protein
MARSKIIYRLGWFSLDERFERLLVHEREFSQEEFEGLVVSALTEVFGRMIEGNRYVSLDNAMPEALEILKRKHGFSPPEIRTVLYENPFEKRLENFIDPKLSAVLPPEFLEKLIEHNTRLWEAEFGCAGEDKDVKG